MKKIMICLFAFGMIAGAQGVRAEAVALAPVVTAQDIELGIFRPRNGKGVANQNNRVTVRKTKSYWNKNARRLRNK